MIWEGHLQAAQAFLQDEVDQAERRLPAAAAVAVVEPLWQLHSTAVRLVHWAAAQRSQYEEGYQLALLLPLRDWRQLADVSGATQHLAVMACKLAIDRSARRGEPEKQQALLHRCVLA